VPTETPRIRCAWPWGRHQRSLAAASKLLIFVNDVEMTRATLARPSATRGGLQACPAAGVTRGATNELAARCRSRSSRDRGGFRGRRPRHRVPAALPGPTGNGALVDCASPGRSWWICRRSMASGGSDGVAAHFVRQEGLGPDAQPAVDQALIGCGGDAAEGHLTGTALAAVIRHLVGVAAAAIGIRATSSGLPGSATLPESHCTAQAISVTLGRSSGDEPSSDELDSAVHVLATSGSCGLGGRTDCRGCSQNSRHVNGYAFHAHHLTQLELNYWLLFSGTSG
jgi:hypothetical protein